MEYAKDEVFNIRYNSLTGAIECGTNHKRRIRRFLKQYKSVMALGIFAIGLSISNMVLIINFFINLLKLK